MARTPTRSALVVGWIMIYAAVVFFSRQAQAENVTAATPSGCQICATTGDCSRAYRGGPGQFCGNWLDQSNTRQSCCCPENAVRWRRRVRWRGAGVHFGMALVAAWVALASLLLRELPVYAFQASKWRWRRTGPRCVSSARPSDAWGFGLDTSVYTAQPAYAQSACGTAPVYGQLVCGSNYRGGMSAGTGVALGVGAGLLGGLLLSEVLADAEHHHNGGHDGGYDGIGGGYDGGGGGDI
ncbi:hypothetical protein FI667_g11865, partial [Globisporangium splendens]